MNFAEINFRVITGVRVAKDLLNTLNHITFIYNPNWDINDSFSPTLPVAFFHVKSCHEVMTSEVSKKAMMFYNSQKGDSKNAVQGGVMNVVADNIVRQPKMYNLELIVPSDKISLLQNSYVLNPAFISHAGNILSGNENTGNIDFLSMVTTSPYAQVIKTVLNIVGPADFSQSFLKSIMNTPDYNKNSLELMWETGSILRMKMWNSWNYKTVAITSFDCSKEPDEDGVYQASISLMELPIMTYAEDRTIDKHEYKNVALALKGALLTTALDKAGTTLGGN